MLALGFLLSHDVGYPRGRDEGEGDHNEQRDCERVYAGVNLFLELRLCDA